MLEGDPDKPPRIFVAIVHKSESRYIGRYGERLSKRGIATTRRSVDDGECGVKNETVGAYFEITSRWSSLMDLDNNDQPIEKEKRWDVLMVKTQWLSPEE